MSALNNADRLLAAVLTARNAQVFLDVMAGKDGAMPHHFTKNTVSATFWCTKCNGPTVHMVMGGRRGPCVPCMEKQQAESAARKAAAEAEPPAAKQMGLFR